MVQWGPSNWHPLFGGCETLCQTLVYVRALQQTSCLLLAPSLPEGEHEVSTRSDEGGGGPLGLAQRVPLREITHTRVR